MLLLVINLSRIGRNEEMSEINGYPWPFVVTTKIAYTNIKKEKPFKFQFLFYLCNTILIETRHVFILMKRGSLNLKLFQI